jgi:hypothetical protein
MVQRRDHLRFALEAVGYLGIAAISGSRTLIATRRRAQIESEVTIAMAPRPILGRSRFRQRTAYEPDSRDLVFVASQLRTAAPHREQNVDFAEPWRAACSLEASAMTHYGHDPAQSSARRDNRWSDVAQQMRRAVRVHSVWVGDSRRIRREGQRCPGRWHALKREWISPIPARRP